MNWEPYSYKIEFTDAELVKLNTWLESTPDKYVSAIGKQLGDMIKEILGIS